MPLFTKITEIKEGKKPGMPTVVLNLGKLELPCAVGRV